MLLPINTDAPVYHFPIVTIGLILLNTVVFLGTYPDEGSMVVIALRFGDGLHPVQWLTCAFLHFDWLHLIGNMIFLWAFGLIVEGKLGWWRFLSVYLGIALAHGLVVQVLMLGYVGNGVAGGASGVIYGLLAMALVWAPMNEFTVFGGVFLFFRAILFDLSIRWFCCFYLAIQFAMAWFIEFEMSSAVLHLLGALIGGPLAIVMLKRGMVDCENWDIFAVMNGTYGSVASYDTLGLGPVPADMMADEAPEEVHVPKDAARRKRNSLMQRVHRAIEEGEPLEALNHFRSWQRRHIGQQPPDEDLLALAEALGAHGEWDEVAMLVEDYLEAPKQSAKTLFRIASLLAEAGEQPELALQLIQLVESHSQRMGEAGRSRLREMRRMLQRVR